MKRRGKTQEAECGYCKKSFLALLIKIREGGGKYCSTQCYQNYRHSHKMDDEKLQRRHQLKHRYGLTEMAYQKLLLGQNNACAICHQKFDKMPYVDHDHNTQFVRGLLCGKCNTAIGMLEDKIERLQNAILYLSR